MKKFIYFFCCLLIVACNKNDNPTPDDSGLFVKFFGSIFNDEGYSIEQTDDGGFLLVGSGKLTGRSNTDAIIIKLDKNGNFVDSVRISGNGDYSARDIIKNEDNDIVVLCNKYSNDSSAVVLVKFSQALEQRGGEYIISDNNASKKAKYLTKSSGNDVLVIGEFTTGIDKDMFILKTDLDTLYWEREIGLFNVADSVGNIKQTEDNHLVWCGSVFRNNGTQSDLRIVKSDDYGNLIWDYGYEENDDIKQYGHSIDLLKDGGYIAAGGIDKADKDVYIIKTNADGQQQLFGQDDAKVIGGAGDQVANSIIETSTGDYILTGYTSTENNKDVYVAKLSKDGTVLWEKEFGGLSGDDVGNYIVECKDGGFIIVATVYVSNNSMMAVYKIDADGKLVR